ncbi:MAG: magnetosome biogenesis CDF transporter MamM [SAR324 cluster bacterium]|nr:magnetosome biogenesis CDF transporter MamM [SAR324 cluster bacterium]
MQNSKCGICYETVGWVGLISNIILSILKLLVGIVSGSQALVADAMYSAKDVVTSVLIILGLKVSGKPIDKEHMYGHGMIEFILSLVVSIVFLAVTAIILLFAMEHLVEGKHRVPHIIALFTAIFAIGANLFLYRYTKCVSVQINSPIVKTLSKHQYSDMLSSGAVACGIIGAHYMGLIWLDSMVALFETVHLLYLGSDLFWDAFKGLMDYSASSEVLQKIKASTLAVTDVKTVRALRTRRIGQGLWIDLVIGLDPDLVVGKANKIVRQVEKEVSVNIEHVTSISVRYESMEGPPDLAAILDGVGENNE